MKKYLLPCSCGQKLEVDAGQSGLMVACACGKSHEVPTLRGLAALEVVQHEDAVQTASAPVWGLGQGLMFVGAIALICGVIALALVLRTRPEWKVHPDLIAVHVDQMTPTQLFERWESLRKGIGGIDDPVRQQFESEWATFNRRRTMAILPLAGGALLIGAGFLLRKQNSGKPA